MRQKVLQVDCTQVARPLADAARVLGNSLQVSRSFAGDPQLAILDDKRMTRAAIRRTEHAGIDLNNTAIMPREHLPGSRRCVTNDNSLCANCPQRVSETIAFDERAATHGAAIPQRTFTAVHATVTQISYCLQCIAYFCRQRRHRGKRFRMFRMPVEIQDRIHKTRLVQHAHLCNVVRDLRP